MSEETTKRCGKCGEPIQLPPGAAELSDALGGLLCAGCFTLWKASRPVPEEPVVEQKVTKYTFTPEMGEISGFGGGYEQTCRNMLAAGLEWLDLHPNADPRFKEMKGVYGVLLDDNDDAKALSEAVTSVDEGCTGAMHHAVIGTCLWIKKNGWGKYVEEMSKKKDGDE